jgi:hypothetical protein
MWIFIFGGNFKLLEFQGVSIIIISMKGKAMEFDIFHVHIAQDVVAGIGHYPIFNLWSFGGGGSSQAMAGVYLLPPTQHQVKGLNQVDQDAHKLKGWSVGARAPTIHMLSCMYLVSITHIPGVQSYSLYLVENNSLWKVRIIPTEESYITPTVLLWSLLSRHNTNFWCIIRNRYCKLLFKVQGVIFVNNTKCYLPFGELTQKNELIADISVD